MNLQAKNLEILEKYAINHKITEPEKLFKSLTEQRVSSKEAVEVWNHYETTFGKRRASNCIYRDCFLTFNPNAFKGNTKSRNQYVQTLKRNGCELTPFQREAAVGLILSDASTDFNSKGDGARLKMQQSSVRYPGLIQHFFELFYEFTGFNGLGIVKTRLNMLELQTLNCYLFYEIAMLFQGDVEKSVQSSIEPFITPVSLAYWWMGDGSKSDFTISKSKGITLHTQCFTKEECLLLTNCLVKNLGLKVRTKEDYTSMKDGVPRVRYRIDIAAQSYERFIQLVGPYIPKFMEKKLPTPRVDGSTFGEGDASYLTRYLGSAYFTNDGINSYKGFEP